MRRFVLALVTLVAGCTTAAPPPAPDLVMQVARAAHTATPLPDGRILVVGGCATDGCGGTERGSELFAGDRFVVGPALASPRFNHTATALGDGRVLVVGGQAGTAHGAGLLDTALLYDPARDAWQPVAGRLPAPAYKLAVAPLPGGGALVVGGQTADDATARLATTLLFSPETGRFTAGPAMSEPRYKISDAVLALPDGRVAVAGGFGVEVYAGGRFLPAARGDVERQYPAVALLPDGALLVTGGYDDRTRVTATALRVAMP